MLGGNCVNTNAQGQNAADRLQCIAQHRGKEKDFKVFLLCFAVQDAKKRRRKKKHLSSENEFVHLLLCVGELHAVAPRSQLRWRRRRISPLECLFLFFWCSSSVGALSLVTFCNNRAMLLHMNLAVICMNVLYP